MHTQGKEKEESFTMVTWSMCDLGVWKNLSPGLDQPISTAKGRKSHPRGPAKGWGQVAPS